MTTKLFVSTLRKKQMKHNRLIYSIIFIVYILVFCLTTGSCSNAISKKEGVSETLFPVMLNEANFYEAHQDAYSIKFNVDWENISVSNNITYVVFGITAKNAQGNPLLTEAGEKTLFFRAFEDGVLPSEHNTNYNFSFHDKGFNEATSFSIYVSKVQDYEGNVWENEESSNSINCVFLGKKGFSFGHESMVSESIIEFVNYFVASCQAKGIAMNSEPQLHSMEDKYCVIRFPNIDIRFDICNDGKIKSEFFSLVDYSTPPDYNNDDDFEKAYNEFFERMHTYFSVIVPATFHEFSASDVILSIDRFFESDSKYIVINNTSYEFSMTSGTSFDEFGNEKKLTVVSLGECPYNPVDFWCFAKEYPYNHSNKNTYAPLQSSQPSSYPADNEDYIVNWTDLELERVIRLALKRPREDIWRSDLDKIVTFAISDSVAKLSRESFTCNNVNISSLDDFIHFRNLQILEFRDVPLVSQYEWSTLQPLDSLTDLRIVNCDIYDINQLVGLPELRQLTMLSLGNNYLTDISPITNMTNLLKLELYNNSITNVSGIENLTKLRDLSLRNNRIIDISPLANLTSLTWLNLSNNCIVDIIPIYNNYSGYLSIDGNNLAIPEPKR